MSIKDSDFNWERMELGATKYDSIMKSFNNTDVSKDEAFQRRFTGFYRIRRSRENFLKPYYEFMESLKGKNIDFFRQITNLYNSSLTLFLFTKTTNTI